MAEIRINKLLRQFNVGLSDFVDFLRRLGVEMDENPNAKISDEYLPEIEKQFGWDLIEHKKHERKESEEEQKVATEKTEIQTRPEQKKPIYHEDFDWDSFDRGDIYGGPEKKAIEEAFNMAHSFIEGQVVEGKVTNINRREVEVSIENVGEGVIPVSEFRYNPELKVGDMVEVYVESAVVRKGQILLSHRKARALKSWDRVNEAYESGEIVKGFIKTRTKGGMIVDVFGTEAFLPGSQIDINPIHDYDQFVNKVLDFKIITLNNEFRNVIISHKVLLEAEQATSHMGNIKKPVLAGTPKTADASEDFDWGVFEE